MDVRIFNEVQKQVPKFNPVVCNGLAYAHMEKAEQYIDNVFRCAAHSFPEGLVYVGYSRCSPQEEYDVITARRNNNKRSIEMTRSDLYLVKYSFTYQGQPLKPRYLYLPFVSDAGMIKILGSTFNISPVLADHAISVGVDNIFIPLNRDKLTFKRLIHPMVVSGRHEMQYVVWSNIHHPSKRRSNSLVLRKIVNMNATPSHYLFCKYGLTQTFKKFFNTDVVAVDQVDYDKYPSNQWLVCESTKIRPKGVRGKEYIPTNIKLLVPISQYNPTIASVVAAFFYLADHFPERVLVSEVDDTTLWCSIMGHIALEPGTSEGKMLIGIDAHLESLDDYIDGMAHDWLRDDGIVVNDIYELFAYIIETMPEKVAQSNSTVASMYDKKLTVLRYALLDVISAIFKMMFEMKKKSKNGTKVLSNKDVIDAMQKYLKPELVIRLNRNHGEVSNISSPTDNKLFKITSNVVLQTSSTGSKKTGSKGIMVDPSRILHSSIAEVGSLNNLPKSEPTGRSRLNPYVKLLPDGSIYRDPAKREVLDKLQESIQR